MGMKLEYERNNVPKLIFLGTANAIPDKNHENTHMAILGENHHLLIDCVSNPIVRLQDAGIDISNITDLILTHFHPDHVSGTPLFLMSSWLMGRKKTLHIYGLKYTLDQIKMMMDAYEWDTWPNFFPVVLHEIPEIEMMPVIESSDFQVFTSPVHHLIPTIGLRIEFPKTGQVMAYSCDTEPCDEVVHLANQVNVLVHEATGVSAGHSSASQAGEIAENAGAKQLYLIHYSTNNKDTQRLVKEAQQTFSGPVYLAEDFMELFF